jgi:hypothetical protein
VREDGPKINALRVAQPYDNAAGFGERRRSRDELLEIAQVLDASEVGRQIGRGFQKAGSGRRRGSRVARRVERQPDWIGLAVRARGDVEVCRFDVTEVQTHALCDRRLDWIW